MISFEVADHRAARELVLVAQARGSLPEVRRVTVPSGDADVTVLLAAAADGPRLPVRWNDCAYPPGPLVCFDLLDPDMPVDFTLEVDDDGAIPARAFRAGHAYAVETAPVTSHYVRWDGRDVLDIDVLEKDREKFFAQPR